MDSLALSFLLSVVDRATAPLAKVGKALDAVGKAGEGLSKAGAAMRVARENVDDFTGRMKAGLEAILAPAAEVDTALARLQADSSSSMDGVAATLANVRASALAWSSAHSNSAAEYITTTNAMMKADLKAADALKATEVALRVTTATGKEASAIASTLAVVYGQMGDKTKDVGGEFSRLGDILTRAQQTFNGIDVSQLSDPLKDALPAAKASKVSVEQVIAVLGQLNASGIKGGEAGAGFAAVLEQMTAASKALGFSVLKTADGSTDLVGTLAAIEKKFGAVKNMTPEMAAKFQAAFGPAAFKAIAGLSGQSDTLAANLDKVTNSAGAAASAQATMEASTAAQMKIANQQVDALKVELAAALVPALQAVLPYVKDVVTAISGFAKEHPGLVSIIGSIAVLAVAAGTVIGPLLSIGGAMASVGGFLLSGAASAITFASTFLATAVPALLAGAVEAWAFAAAMLANPITWIVLAIVALAAVIYIYWEPISKFFLSIWDKVKVYFEMAWKAILAVWDKVVGVLTSVWNEITGAFKQSFVGGILTLLKYMSPIGWIMKAWELVLPYLLTVWGNIKKAFEGGFINGMAYLLETFSPQVYIYKAWDALSKWLFGRSLKDEAIHIVASLWDTFTGRLGKMIDDVKAAFDQGFLQGMNKLFATFNPFAIIYNTWNDIVKWLFGISLADAALKVLSTLWDGLQGITKLSTDLVGWIGRALVSALAALGSFIWEGLSHDIDRVVGAFDGLWAQMKTAVDGGLSGILGLLTQFNPLVLIVQAWDAVTQWLFGFSLIDAGKNIVNTIVEGITAMASAPVEAMKGIVGSIRNLLPFSPAKEGPLKDLHKVKLVETIADGVTGGPLVAAMTGVAGDAMNAVTSVPVPNFASAPPSQTNPASAGGANIGGGGGGPITVNLNLSGAGGDAVAQLEAWLRDPSNQARLAGAVQSVTQREKAKELG